MDRKTKIYKISGLAIKTAIILFSFWFIYHRVFVKDNLDYEVFMRFQHVIGQLQFIRMLLVVVGLMFVNWGLETFKWRFLIGKIEKVSFLNALVAVLSGLTVSIFTPNRVGEYAGRVFVLEKADRWEGVFITMLGSISQLIITLIAGAIGFIFFAYDYYNLNNSPIYYNSGLILIVIILVALLLLLYFNISFLTGIAGKLPGRLKKISHYGSVFSLYSKSELCYVLLFSLTRYMVFITQFYLLLNMFGANIPYADALLMLSMVYLAMTAIPTIALTEIGIRGSVCLYFIGMYFDVHNPAAQNDLAIVTASSVLWVINLAVPALLGAIFVFRLKIFRKD